MLFAYAIVLYTGVLFRKFMLIPVVVTGAFIIDCSALTAAALSKPAPA